MALAQSTASPTLWKAVPPGAYTCNEHPSFAFVLPEIMRDFLVFAGFLIAWVALTRWVLPRFGVPT